MTKPAASIAAGTLSTSAAAVEELRNRGAYNE